MARRCSHLILLVDDFIEPEGAFASCLFCSAALELSGSAMDYYLPFEHTSPKGKDFDCITLIHTTLVQG